MIHLSTQLSNALLATNSLKGLIDGSKIKIYSGPVPANADAAVDGSSVLLSTITAAAGAGITFDGTPVNGVLTKTAAETWAGTNAATGVASFYRTVVGSDTGATASASGNYRVQGSIGTDASFDMVFTSTSLTSGNSQPVQTYQLLIPS